MSFIAPHIEKLQAYIPGKQEVGKKYIKLNTNENAFPPPKNLLKMIAKFDFTGLREYPDPNCKKIRRLLSKQFNLTDANIIVGNGSDEILNLLFKAFVHTNKKSYFVNPTYSLYKTLAEINNCKYEMIELEKDFSLPWKDLENINEGVIMIPNPNAPTGILASNKKLLDFATTKPNVLLVVDEAYNDFGGESLASKTKELKNLIVVRTLSKSYSLAGLRLGFAFGPENLISALYKIKDSYNVDYLSQLIGEKALLPKMQKKFQANINKIKKNREWTNKKLEKLGFHCLASKANFIFASPPNKPLRKSSSKLNNSRNNCLEKKQLSAKELFQALAKKKILTRYFSGDRTEDFIRISIGKKKEMRKLIRLIKKILNS